MKQVLLRSMSPCFSFFRKFSVEQPVRHWYPTRFFVQDEKVTDFALVLLNSRPTPEAVDAEYILKLWPKAKIRACADGGANRLASLNAEKGTDFCPDFICGDLDSIRKENLELFREKGSVIFRDESVNSTDYTKTARMLAKMTSDGHNPKVNTMVTIGGLYGRFDHIMGCVQTLFLLRKDHPTLSIYCFLYRSMFMLLPPGNHRIHVDESVSSGVCGLVPIGGPAERVTTTGLEWNLDAQRMEFGSLISTSNHVIAPEVHVTTSHPLLWILNLKI